MEVLPGALRRCLMEELVALVAKKAGIGDDKARTAVESVVAFIKGRMPESMAGQLDGLIAGGAASKATDVTAKLGGLASGLTGGLGGGGGDQGGSA
ncbi:MAG: hypothetical protein GEU99_10450 [Luteitalea sp.]|nr:hypothetical protein [Luteitalea sp.]